MSFEQLQDEVTLWLGRGEKLDDVEAKLLGGAVALSDDERAALWLFAWSYRASDRHHGARVRLGPER